MIFKRKKKKRGFTLIEVLITMLILSAVLTSFITCFIYGFNVLSRTRQTAIAAQCVQKELEAIRNMPFNQLLTLDTSWTHENLAKLENGQGSLAVQDSGLGEDIKKLTVRVTWTYRGRNMRDEIVTYVTKGGINKK
jgi:prepilin-type N-terminal cleavage/methylation domain-containing protein